jgi:hypothetical protein
MTSVEQFIDVVQRNLEEEVVSSQPSEFDPSELLEILLPVLIDVMLTLLDGCLSRSGPEAVAARMQTPGVFRSFAIRKALRLSKCPSSHRAECAEAVARTCDQVSEDLIVGVIEEVQGYDKEIDWSLF